MEKGKCKQRICIKVLFFNGMIESPFRDYISKHCRKIAYNSDNESSNRKENIGKISAKTVSEFI